MKKFLSLVYITNLGESTPNASQTSPTTIELHQSVSKVVTDIDGMHTESNVTNKSTSDLNESIDHGRS